MSTFHAAKWSGAAPLSDGRPLPCDRGSSGVAVTKEGPVLVPGLFAYRIGQTDIEMSIPIDFIKAYTQGAPYMSLHAGGLAAGARSTDHMTESRHVDFGSRNPFAKGAAHPPFVWAFV